MTEPTQRTRPSVATRKAEGDQARVKHEADRAPTSQEEESVEEYAVDRSVAEHEEDMLTRGANQKGEGRLHSFIVRGTMVQAAAISLVPRLLRPM